MSKIKLVETGFDNLLIVKSEKFGDERGYFSETYNYRELKAQGIDIQFVQDNQSRSCKGVVRGLHFQIAPHAQTKLVRVLSGVVLDTVIDLRKDKKTFGRIFQLEMSAENGQQLLIPKGFAHGFAVLSDFADLLYKTDDFHYPELERGILFNDPALNIDWRILPKDMIVSDRDKKHSTFAEGKYSF